MTDAVQETTRTFGICLTLGKRIGVCAALFLAVHIVSHAAWVVTATILAYRLAPSWEWMAHVIVNYLLNCGAILCASLVLLAAQRSIVAGNRHWLASMPESRLIIVLAILFAVSRLMPVIAFDSSLFGDQGPSHERIYLDFLRGLGGATAVAACYIWLWWCNSPPRVEQLVLVTALAWVGFEFLLVAFDVFLPTLNVLVTRTSEAGKTIPLPGSDAFAHVTGRAWIWDSGATFVMQSLGQWLKTTILPVPIAAAIAVTFYKMVGRVSAPSANR